MIPAEYVLELIKTNYGTVGVAVTGHSKTINSLADVPLERIDRDNSDNLDKADGLSGLSGPVHERADSLEAMNYVGAATASTDSEPLGTEYNHRREVVVSLRLEGAHVEHYGAIDPQKGTANEHSRSYPTITWKDLKLNVRRSILADRTFPTPGEPTVAYKDLFIENESDAASEFTSHYRWDADVRFVGFEQLP